MAHRQELGAFNASCVECCHGGESTCQAKVQVFSFEQIPITLSALPNDTDDSPFVLVKLIHSKLYPVFAFLAAHFLGHLARRPSLNRLCHSKMLYFFIVYSLWANVDRANVSLAFFTSVRPKLDVYLLLEILVTHFSASSILRTCTASSAAWEWTIHLVYSSCNRMLNMYDIYFCPGWYECRNVWFCHHKLITSYCVCQSQLWITQSLWKSVLMHRPFEVKYHTSANFWHSWKPMTNLYEAIEYYT
jgi:hypothetical protein